MSAAPAKQPDANSIEGSDHSRTYIPEEGLEVSSPESPMNGDSNGFALLIVNDALKRSDQIRALVKVESEVIETGFTELVDLQIRAVHILIQNLDNEDLAGQLLSFLLSMEDIPYYVYVLCDVNTQVDEILLDSSASYGVQTAENSLVGVSCPDIDSIGASLAQESFEVFSPEDDIVGEFLTAPEDQD